MAQAEPKTDEAAAPPAIFRQDETGSLFAVNMRHPEGRALCREMFRFTTPEERAAFDARRAYERNLQSPEFRAAELAAFQAEMDRQRAGASVEGRGHPIVLRHGRAA